MEDSSMHSRSSEHRSHTPRSARLIATLVCIGALAGCAGSRESEPPPATAATEPEPAEAPPPADPATLKQDQRAIDKAAMTSERLADQTASQTENARNHAAVPAGTPKSAPQKDNDATQSQRPADNTAKPADNTAKNERDRNDATPTPTDQSNSSSDVELSAKIRRAIVGAEDLSFTARNVKIIAENGLVTLRGPVASAEEKARVEATARRAAGSARVVSKLEVEK
jgi:hyperosmotically inducible protein